MNLRICKICAIEKPLETFPRDSRSKQGHRHTCKECVYAYMKQYRSIHSKQLHDYFVEYCAAHKAELAQKKAIYYAEHSEEARAYSRLYRQLHPEKIIAASAARAANPERTRQLSKARYARNPDKRRAQAQTYRAAHPERARQSQKIYYDKAPEQRRKASRCWYAQHRQHVKTRSRAYRLANPAIIDANKARYRARKAHAPINDLTAAQWREIKAAYGYRCAYCGKKMQRLTQDHITPLNKGGAHTASNIVPACPTCNSTKQDGPPLAPVQPLLLTIASSKKKRSI